MSNSKPASKHQFTYTSSAAALPHALCLLNVRHITTTTSLLCESNAVPLSVFIWSFVLRLQLAKSDTKYQS